MYSNAFNASSSRQMLSKNFVLELDHQLMVDGVPIHARPMAVAQEWLRSQRIQCNLFDDRIWTPLNAIYRELYPSSNFAMPSLQVGAVLLRDSAFLVRIGHIWGEAAVDPLKCIEIPIEELELIWRHWPDQVHSAVYSWLTYGISLWRLKT